MKIYTVILWGLIMGVFFSFKADNLKEWNSGKLEFSDLQGRIPKNPVGEVSMKTIITYQLYPNHKKPPKLIVYNYIDKNSSWATKKREGILELLQIRFDYSELYTRKIRKHIAEMNKKGITNQKDYMNAIEKIAQQSHKRQREINMSLWDQDYLIKILQKEVSDSLDIYKNFKK